MVRGCVPRAIAGLSLDWGNGAAAAGVRTLVWSPPTPGLLLVKGLRPMTARLSRRP
jgi:hypothetical protein